MRRARGGLPGPRTRTRSTSGAAAPGSHSPAVGAAWPTSWRTRRPSSRRPRRQRRRDRLRQRHRHHGRLRQRADRLPQDGERREPGGRHQCRHRRRAPIAAEGGDANIDLTLAGKGTGHRTALLGVNAGCRRIHPLRRGGRRVPVQPRRRRPSAQDQQERRRRHREPPVPGRLLRARRDGHRGRRRFPLRGQRDGSAWNEAIVVDRSTGRVSLPATPLAQPSPSPSTAGRRHYHQHQGGPGNFLRLHHQRSRCGPTSRAPSSSTSGKTRTARTRPPGPTASRPRPSPPSRRPPSPRTRRSPAGPPRSRPATSCASTSTAPSRSSAARWRSK